ncbi:hypothetical protein ACWFRB_00135 [Rhodococcus sp. NPDC055112]
MAIAAVVIAVFAIDMQSVLNSDPAINQAVGDASRKRDAAASELLAKRWNTTRNTTVTTTLWDLAKVVALTSAPLIVLVTTTTESSTGGERLVKLGIAMVCGTFSVALTVFSTYGGVLHFVTKNHFSFLNCAFVGAFWYLSLVWIAGMAWTSGAGVPLKLGLTAGIAWFAFLPPALIAVGLREQTSSRLPGSSARPNLHAALKKRHGRLVNLPGQKEGQEAANTALGRLARISRWYKRVTGTTPDQPTQSLAITTPPAIA